MVHWIMDPIILAQELAAVMRVAVRHGLIDAAGFVAARHPSGDGLLITPGSRRAGRFRRLVAEEIVHVRSGDDLPAEGVPAETALAFEALRIDPGAQTVLYGAPSTMMLLGSVGLDPQPLTHTNAELVHAGISRIVPDSGLAVDSSTARALLNGSESTPTRHLVGVGVLTVGHTPWEALRRIDALELMAAMTLTRMRTGLPSRIVSPDDAQSIIRQRPHEDRPSRDPVRYYRSRDLGTEGTSLVDFWPGGRVPATVEDARIALSVSSRLLASEGLVAFFEHISHRAPGHEDRFLMTNAHDFTQMEPGDVGILAMEGDCEPLESRYPPAPFRWLHRDMLRARADINAIVHTHPIHGRIEALTGPAPIGWHRYVVGTPEHIPTFDEPSLLFDEAHRRVLVGFLADADAAHAIHHGTDFVAADIETATIRAIHHDRRAREDARAREIGIPSALPDAGRRDVSRYGPTPADWWDFYASALGPLTEVDPAPTDLSA